jgi:stearoyl-CoA desaturase (delta-9 desaturase)
MPLARKLANLTAVVLPFVGLLAAIVLLWNRAVGWTELIVFAVLYVLTGFGITVGFHRLFTHRSFETSRAGRIVFATLGSMAVEGPLLYWVADHRNHHAHSDQEGDPHSPHHHDGALAGLWHAHVGWLFRSEGNAPVDRYAKDLRKDRDLVRVHKAFPLLVAFTFALPFAIGYAVSGTLAGALSCALWGGLVRVFLVHHVTWSINSVCHFFGRRRFATTDESRNVFWLALPSFGEAWHHNHHAFPTSAAHGLRWYEVDISALLIRSLERLGLVWNVVRISPERQAAMQAKRRAATAPSTVVVPEPEPVGASRPE